MSAFPLVQGFRVILTPNVHLYGSLTDFLRVFRVILTPNVHLYGSSIDEWENAVYAPSSTNLDTGTHLNE